jgi:hypothetical protein
MRQGTIIFAWVFLKEPLLQAQLTSGLVNGEDFSTPGERGGNYNFGMGFSKELLLQAQLTSGLVNGEDLPMPGE